MEKFGPTITISATTSSSQSSSGTASPDLKPLSVPTTYNPRIIKPSEYKAAALCLAEAFATDDVAQYFIETGDRTKWTAAKKWDLHVSILEYVVSAHCLRGLAMTIGPNYDSVALCNYVPSAQPKIKIALCIRMPPGSNMDDWYTIIRSGMWRLNYKLSSEGKKRFFTEFLPLLHNTKQETLGPRDNDSWYLVYIGTKTAGRGKGYARKLIEYVTRIADEQGRACYLESSNEVNPVIYARLGFEMTKKIHLTRGAKPIELDIMIREPVMLKKG